jgi:hypothetical protein
MNVALFAEHLRGLADAIEQPGASAREARPPVRKTQLPRSVDRPAGESDELAKKRAQTLLRDNGYSAVKK